MTEPTPAPGAVALRAEAMILNAVVHPSNEQPFTADLFAMPTPADLNLVCTNVRTSSGKRPVWADAQDSIYYFPWGNIRFLEVPEASLAPGHAARTNRSASRAASRTQAPEPETELEIDEDFLRRVRDV